MVKIPFSLTCWVSSVHQALPACISSLEETAGRKVAQSFKREGKSSLVSFGSHNYILVLFCEYGDEKYSLLLSQSLFAVSYLTWFLDVITGTNKEDNAS